MWLYPVSIVDSFCTGRMGMTDPPVWLYPVSSLLMNTYSLISPLLYAYRSKRVQRDVRKVKLEILVINCAGFVVFACNLHCYCETWISC